jgi:hypothetical protein
LEAGVTTQHWRDRVQERIGNVDPATLAEGIIWAIENNRTDLVEFVGRLGKTGKRLFRFRVPDGRSFCAVINTDTMALVTCLSEGEALRVIKGRLEKVVPLIVLPDKATSRKKIARHT